MVFFQPLERVEIPLLRGCESLIYQHKLHLYPTLKSVFSLNQFTTNG